MFEQNNSREVSRSAKGLVFNCNAGESMSTVVSKRGTSSKRNSRSGKRLNRHLTLAALAACAILPAVPSAQATAINWTGLTNGTWDWCRFG